MSEISLPELELRVIEILQSQGLPIEEIHLIGLLGKGNRATAFSVTIDGVYHVLKVYDSQESMQAELRNLRKIIPKDRFLFWWQEAESTSPIFIAIIEVPEGSELTSNLLDERVMHQLAINLADLHRLQYKQQVSVGKLKEQFKRWKQPFLDHVTEMGRDIAPYQEGIDKLKDMLESTPDLFRINKARIHGDFWWPNIIVAKEDVYFIDWESVKRGDPAEDIAKLRIFTYGYRSPTVPTFFWASPSDAPKMSQLMHSIAEQNREVTGDKTLPDRLKFYLPYYCVHELGNRHLFSQTKRAMDQIVADDFLNLLKDPLTPPPTLSSHGYFEEVESLRFPQ